jgi:hypothetical protein
MSCCSFRAMCRDARRGTVSVVNVSEGDDCIALWYVVNGSSSGGCIVSISPSGNSIRVIKSSGEAYGRSFSAVLVDSCRRHRLATTGWSPHSGSHHAPEPAREALLLARPLLLVPTTDLPRGPAQVQQIDSGDPLCFSLGRSAAHPKCQHFVMPPHAERLGSPACAVMRRWFAVLLAAYVSAAADDPRVGQLAYPLFLPGDSGTKLVGRTAACPLFARASAARMQRGGGGVGGVVARGSPHNVPLLCPSGCSCRSRRGLTSLARSRVLWPSSPPSGRTARASPSSSTS